MRQALPPPLQELVRRAAAGPGLSGAERADVARELTSHLCEGLEAGVAPERLLEAFGDPTVAALLIARARRRMRPSVLRWTTVAMKIAASCALAAYLSSALRLHAGAPATSPIAERSLFAGIIARDATGPRTPETARRAFEDLFDRIYTRDGGRLTASGLRMLQALEGKTRPGLGSLVLEPVYFAMPASRPAVEREVTVLLAPTERELRLHGAVAAAQLLEDSWRERARSTVWQLRFYPVAAMTPEVIEWLRDG